MPPPPEPFDPVDFLTVAHTIAQHQTEGALRSAVSRAYYFVFHFAQQYTGINRAYGGNSIHWEVVTAVRQSDEDLGQKCGRSTVGAQVSWVNFHPCRQAHPACTCKPAEGEG